MIKRSTWILVAVFLILLVAAIFFSRSMANTKPATSTPTTGQTTLFSFQSTDVGEVSIQDKQGQLVDLRREGTAWVLVQPAAEFTDSAAVEAAVSQLVALRVTSTLDAGLDLARFGLVQPAYTITVILQDGTQHTVLVGDMTATGTGYYLKVDNGAPQVVGTYGLGSTIKFLSAPPIATPTVTPTVEPTPPVGSSSLTVVPPQMTVTPGP